MKPQITFSEQASSLLQIEIDERCSEDAVEEDSLSQWIEVFNNSDTQAVNLRVLMAAPME